MTQGDSVIFVLWILFFGFAADNYTEELLSLHDCELLKVKQFYEEACPLLDSIEKWERNWILFQDFEVPNN